MKTSSRDHLENIFVSRGSPLQKIFNAYESHQKLEKSFLRDLPEAYKNQVKFLFYQNGVMTLCVNSSAMLSRFKYIKNELVEHFKKQPDWAGLREIKVKIHH